MNVPPHDPVSQMIVPVDGAAVLDGGGFGERENIGGVNLLPNGKEMHHGIDYSAAIGTPIKAAAAGTVIVAETNPYGGGLETVIDHGVDESGQRLYSRYLHQSRLDVAVGDVVRQGQTIGAVGNTGNTTGPHLHFEVSNAFTKHGWSKETVDPNRYLAATRAAQAPTPPPATSRGEHAAASARIHIVQPGESIGSIALRHGTTWQALHAANADTIANPNLIHPGARIRIAADATPVAPAATASYIVRSGDTLGGIARHHGIALDALVAANRDQVGTNPNLIHAGTRLRVPTTR